MEEKHILKKYQHSLLPLVLNKLGLSEDELQLLTHCSDKTILNSFVDTERYETAISFLALGLPKREAVWWSYLCVEQARSDCPDRYESIDELLILVRDWVKSPTIEAEQEAKRLIHKSYSNCAATWCVKAFCWCSDDISTGEGSVIKPGKFMHGTAVANAILSAASSYSPESEVYPNCIKRGLHIAMGGNGRIQVLTMS